MKRRKRIQMKVMMILGIIASSGRTSCNHSYTKELMTSAEVRQICPPSRYVGSGYFSVFFLHGRFIMKFNRLVLIALSLTVMMLALIGCGKDTARDGQKKLQVVATTTMLTDLVKEIGGDDVSVQGLMGPASTLISIRPAQVM
nr:hypothetical protein [Veillonella denticariosi]